MSQGEHGTDVGSVAPDVSLGKTPSDGAVADRVTALSYCRSGGRSSCLEAIPEVCQPHVLVLLTCCDARCARPWTVADSSSVSKTLSQAINGRMMHI